MEQCSPYGLFYYDEEEVAGMVELRSFLVQTMGLEAAILSAQEEIARKEEEITHMKDLLMAAIRERDQAHHESQKLLLHNLSLQRQLNQIHQLQKAKAAAAVDTSSNNHPNFSPDKKSLPAAAVVNNSNTNPTVKYTSSCDNDDSSTTFSDQQPLNSPPAAAAVLPVPSPQPQIITTLGKQRPLPSKGKLLQAVMEAGPLLQTLMLAGPLPQWQHPPPQLDSIDIPPVTIPSSSNNSSSLQLSPNNNSSSPSPSPSSSTLVIKQKTMHHQDSINSKKRPLVVPENFDGSSSSSVIINPSSSPSSCSKLQRVA